MASVMSRQRASTNTTTQQARALLIAGVVAGPLFTVAGLIQAFTRPGFDLRRHALSLLETGDLGWIQVANFLVAGALFVACALGMRQVLRGGRGGTWMPILVGAFGIGMIGAGVFTADPGLGFPPGTPEGVNAISTHGLVHLISATLAFLALIAACFVRTRHYVAQQRWGWAAYSVATAVTFFISFGGLASGQLFLNLAFVLTALNAFIWVSVVAAQLLLEPVPDLSR